MQLAEFLEALFQEGRIQVAAAPASFSEHDPAALQVLEKAYRTAAFDLAGPAMQLDRAVALAAARLTYRAAWFLLSAAEPERVLSEQLVMPGPPSRPEQHLSADLVFRYHPAIQRRARGLSPGDALPRLLVQLLRTWPLSGVLAELEEAPLTPLEFGDQRGLWFLYAERLAQHPKAAWFPTGRGMEYVELVWHELGKDLTLLTAMSEPRP